MLTPKLRKAIDGLISKTYWKFRSNPLIDKEDMQSEVELALLKLQPKINNGVNFDGYIYKVARNAIYAYLNQFRNEFKKSEYEPRYEPTYDHVVVEDLLNHLTEIERELITDRHIHGLNLFEMSKKHGCSPQNIHVKLNKIRDKLRHQICKQS
jgi:RNA polymerase sigma factor (sigma-70 family)